MIKKRDILHIVVAGNPDWEPSTTDMELISELSLQPR
jgi:hypothetical protein